LGWAQCSKCPRPDRDSKAPPDAEKSRCAPYPVQSCPVTGAHCPPPVQCCRKTSCSDDCVEFLPYKCPPMPAINCTPNIPPSGWSVLSWKPSPAAYRTDPQTQMPSDPCTTAKPTGQTSRRRPCEARDLCAAPRPMTLRDEFERPPPSAFKPMPCNTPPDHAPVMTCGDIGSRKLVERVDFKYNFPGTRYCSSSSELIFILSGLQAHRLLSLANLSLRPAIAMAIAIAMVIALSCPRPALRPAESREQVADLNEPVQNLSAHLGSRTGFGPDSVMNK